MPTGSLARRSAPVVEAVRRGSRSARALGKIADFNGDYPARALEWQSTDNSQREDTRILDRGAKNAFTSKEPVLVLGNPSLGGYIAAQHPAFILLRPRINVDPVQLTTQEPKQRGRRLTVGEDGIAGGEADIVVDGLLVIRWPQRGLILTRRSLFFVGVLPIWKASPQAGRRILASEPKTLLHEPLLPTLFLVERSDPPCSVLVCQQGVRHWHKAAHLHLSINLVGYPGVQRKQRDTSLDRPRQPELTQNGHLATARYRFDLSVRRFIHWLRCLGANPLQGAQPNRKCFRVRRCGAGTSRGKKRPVLRRDRGEVGPGDRRSAAPDAATKDPGLWTAAADTGSKCMIIEDAAMGEQESEQLQEKRARQEELGPVMGCQMDFRIGGAFPHDIVCARAPLMCRMQSGQSLWTPDAGMKILLESPKDGSIVIEPRAEPEGAIEKRGDEMCEREGEAMAILATVANRRLRVEQPFDPPKAFSDCAASQPVELVVWVALAKEGQEGLGPTCLLWPWLGEATHGKGT
jgi:hypothetical protein